MIFINKKGGINLRTNFSTTYCLRNFVFIGLYKTLPDASFHTADEPAVRTEFKTGLSLLDDCSIAKNGGDRCNLKPNSHADLNIQVQWNVPNMKEKKIAKMFSLARNGFRSLG